MCRLLLTSRTTLGPNEFEYNMYFHQSHWQVGKDSYFSHILSARKAKKDSKFQKDTIHSFLKVGGAPDTWSWRHHKFSYRPSKCGGKILTRDNLSKTFHSLRGGLYENFLGSKYLHVASRMNASTETKFWREISEKN